MNFSKPNQNHKKSLPKAFQVLCLIAIFILALALNSPDGFAQSDSESQTTQPASETATETNQTSDAGSDEVPTSVEESTPAEDAAVEIAAPADALQLNEAVRQRIDAIENQSKQIQAALQRENLDDKQLSDLRSKITALREEAQDISLSLSPHVQAVQQRLEQLGAPPGEGETPEAPEVTKEREQQAALLTEISGAVTRTKLLVLTAGQTATVIAERRRTFYSDRIFERRFSILDLTLWENFSEAVPVAIARFNLLISDWAGSIGDKAGWGFLLINLAVIAFAGVLTMIVHRSTRRFENRSHRPAGISSHTRITHAAAVALAITAIPTLTAVALFGVFDTFDLLPTRIRLLAQSEVLNITLFFGAFGLLTALLAPRRPHWRVAHLDDDHARKLFLLMICAVGVFVVDNYLDRLGTILFTPLDLAIGKGAIASLIIAFLFALVARKIGSAANNPVKVSDTITGALAPIATSTRWRWLQIACWVAVIAIPVAAVFGYLSLAQFIATEIVIATIIMGAAGLTMRFVDAMLTRGMGPGGVPGYAERLGNTLGIRRTSIEQGAIILSGLFRLLIALLALSLLLIPWGFETKDIFGWLRRAFFGFSFGEISISISSILQALGLFVLGIVATRAIQRWLEVRYLPHTNLDIGVRDSLKTATGYLGVIIAATVGFSFLGFDMSNVAIVAGALSLGIGFGLQSVVNNFVSGLILLVERPIKSGDWIVVGADEGYVRKISVRSTEIETFDNATVIVPNSNLISGVVTNWMHGNTSGRIKIPIGVGYGSNPEEVQDILLDIVTNHPEILKTPAPRVYFLDFGDSALSFEVRAYLKNIDFGMSVKSDLRITMLNKLRAANIEIPFPQRDLHLHYADKKSEPAGKTSKATPKRTRKRKAVQPIIPDGSE